MANSTPENPNASSVEATDVSAQAPISTTKRTLLKAGWVVPAIMVVSLPRSGFAANISGSTGSNNGNNGHHGKGGEGDIHGHGHGDNQVDDHDHKGR